MPSVNTKAGGKPASVRQLTIPTDTCHLSCSRYMQQDVLTWELSGILFSPHVQVYRAGVSTTSHFLASAKCCVYGKRITVSL